MWSNGNPFKKLEEFSYEYLTSSSLSNCLLYQAQRNRHPPPSVLNPGPLPAPTLGLWNPCRDIRLRAYIIPFSIRDLGTRQSMTRLWSSAELVSALCLGLSPEGYLNDISYTISLSSTGRINLHRLGLGGLGRGGRRGGSIPIAIRSTLCRSLFARRRLALCLGCCRWLLAGGFAQESIGDSAGRGVRGANEAAKHRTPDVALRQQTANLPICEGIGVRKRRVRVTIARRQ